MRISDWSSDVCSSDLSGHESGGIGEHAVTSGLEGAWVNTPTEWSENYFRLLLDYEYELVRSPAGAQQWQPVNQRQEDMAPAAWDSSKKVPTMMTTADMALKVDPELRKISEKFRSDPDAFKLGRASCRERESQSV